MGAFFGFGADQFACGLGLVCADARRSARRRACLSASICEPTRSSWDGINPRSGSRATHSSTSTVTSSPTDVPTVGSPSLTSRPSPISIGLVELGGTFLQAVFGDLNWMIWLSFLVLILTYVVLRTSLGSHPGGRGTPASCRHGRDLRLRIHDGAVITWRAAALGGAYLSAAA